MSNTVQAPSAQATRPASGPTARGRARHRRLALGLILLAQLLLGDPRLRRPAAASAAGELVDDAALRPGHPFDGRVAFECS